MNINDVQETVLLITIENCFTNYELVSVGKGLFTCGHGKEEENATKVPRYGVVDEAQAIAISIKAKSTPL